MHLSASNNFTPAKAVSIDQARSEFITNQLEPMLTELKEDWNRYHEEVEDHWDFWNGQTIEPIIEHGCNYSYIKGWNIPSNFFLYEDGIDSRVYNLRALHIPITDEDQDEW